MVKGNEIGMVAAEGFETRSTLHHPDLDGFILAAAGHDTAIGAETDGPDPYAGYLARVPAFCRFCSTHPQAGLRRPLQRPELQN